MKFRFKSLRNAVFLLLVVTLFSSMLMAQKRPKNVSLDVNADDVQFCSARTTFENSRKTTSSQQQQRQDLNDLLSDLSDQLRELRGQLKNLREQRSSLREKINILQKKQQEQQQQQQQTTKDQLNDLKNQLKELKEEQDGLQQRQDTLQRQQQQLISQQPDDNNDAGNQLCLLYYSYLDNLKNGNSKEAMYDRNDMIDLVVGQIDAYFKHRKDGRKSKIRIFETILDFLRIGGELAVTIMNGERAKSIIGASLAGLDTGRTKFDKNFEVLATQVLVNNMIAKRIRIQTEFSVAKDKPVRAAKASDAYTWNQARNDLQRYLLAGTFDDALDTLVKKSGADVEEAEKNLRIVEKRPITGELPEGFLDGTRTAVEILNGLEANLTDPDPAVRENSLKILQQIIDKLLEKSGTIKEFVEAENLGDSPTGAAIVQALVNVRSKLDDEKDGDPLINALDLTIIEIKKNNK